MGSEASKPTLHNQTSARRIHHYNQPTAAEKMMGRLNINEDDDDFVRVEDEKIGGEKHSFRTPWKTLSVDTLVRWEEEVHKDGKNRLAIRAMAQAAPSTVLTSQRTLNRDAQVFSTVVPLEGNPITYQRQSGRCWIFAATNIFRIAVMKRYDLASFELSQSYIFFYDKLEKSNWFLEQILDTAQTEDVTGRLVQTLMRDPVGDGGQWDMLDNIVRKYGVLPQTIYPDAWSAKASAQMDRLVTTKLREDALILRSMVGKKSVEEIVKCKAGMMKEIHRILTLHLGSPPSPDEEFSWSYLDAKGAAHTVKSTPLAFFSDILSCSSSSPASQLSVAQPSTLFSLLHDPRHKPNTLLGVSRLGNVVGGRAVTYVNVTMPVLKNACIAMLKAGHPVFFGSDVGKYLDIGRGVMDLDVVDYELGFNVKLGMDKRERIITGESMMTHAMVLTGVHLEKEEEADSASSTTTTTTSRSSSSSRSSKEVSRRWRVQNSWGPDAGDHGWFVMSDAWMDEFVYQAVVETRFVSEEVRSVLEEGEVQWLELWDPMGALA